MEVIDGQWYMNGLDWEDEGCIHSSDELLSVIDKVGFLPLFSNSIEGFSLEEHTCPEDWWCGDPAVDPWEWRAIIARGHQAAYGKFFEGKAGFISAEYLPYFVNARRDGYDFDARWDDEKASLREKKIMDLFMGGGTELFSYEIRDRAGFGKGKEKGFEGTITRLQMETYLCVTDFRQKKNRRGESYGWSIAILTRPEDIWGDIVTSAYSEDPEQSAQRIGQRMQELYPAVTARQLKKIVGRDIGLS